MRLDCEVTVQNWSSSQGLVCRRKKTRACICIGRKPSHSSQLSDQRAENGIGDVMFLSLCTPSDMSGSKYKISGNISEIFGKFIHEGKATIRFRQPSHELCVSKADPICLKKFLMVLKGSSHRCNSDVKKMPVLPCVKKADMKKNQREMMLLGSNEYLKAPVTFPESLNKLSIVDCRLIRFDVRILTLVHLVELDLSQNKLKELNFSLERLTALRTLNLSSNELKTIPSTFCRSSKLVSLDLSHNELSYIPIAFCAMRSLVNLKLNSNRIVSLPSNIGELCDLRLLDVSNNNLILLPWPIVSELNLDKLDVAWNKFYSSDIYDAHNTLSCTLQEYAACVIREARLFYNQNMVGKLLCDFLDSAKKCFKCRGWCISCIYSIGFRYPQNLAQEVVGSGERFLPLELYYCSLKCITC